MADETRNLPAIPDADLEQIIYDGEVVGDEEAAAAQSSRTVPLSPGARFVFRQFAYVAAGVIILGRRWNAARTRHERMMRKAEAAGDDEAVLKWATLKVAAAREKRERREGRAETFVAIVKVSPVIACLLLGAMIALSLALALGKHHIAAFADPWLWIAGAVVIGVQVTWVLLIILAIGVPVLTMLLLHHVGRTGDLLPRWGISAKTGEDERGLVVTADSTVLALKNLSIAPLKTAFKDSLWTPTFHTLPVREGRGYTYVHSLPLGVTAQMIADQNKVYARNMHRAEVEVWPTDAERAGIAPAGYMAVWVADPGVLDEAAPEYPLLHEGTADVFKGVPAGISPRGDAISIPVVGHNFAVGGIMGQGKSNGCRVLMLGAALDPLAVLQVHVFAYNGDFDAYEPRLARYVKGAEDEHITAGMETLHELYADVGRREARLSELGALKVSRSLAAHHPELRPKLTLFSECHELFGHRRYGEEAADLAVSVIRRARKTALWLGFDTQDARKDAIPPKIVGLVSVNACFAVKTWRANDGFLGDGSFQAGIRATELRPGRDVGRSLVTGVSDAQFELLKWHYIRADEEKGIDDAVPVIARAVKQAARGTALMPDPALAVLEAQRDLLGDLDTVLAGDYDRVRLADLPARLRKLAPAWGPYRALNGAQLQDLLDDEGVRWTNSGNVPRLDPEDLRRVLAERVS